MVDNAFEGQDDDLSFDFETNGEVKSEDVMPSAGGKSVNREGKYHCMVVSVKKENAAERKSPMEKPKQGQSATHSPPSVKLAFTVLAGDFADQVNRMVYHDLWLWHYDAETQQFRLRTGKDLKFALQICRGLGLCEQKDVDAGVLNVNFKNAQHQQCVLEVRNDPYEVTENGVKIKKDSFKIPFGNVWRVTDSAVEDVVKDPESMAIALQAMAAGGNTGTPPQLF